MKSILVPTLTMLLSSAAVTGAIGQPVQTGHENLVLAEIKNLPPPPAPADREFCDHLTIEPQTPGGQLAEKLGWAVTGEVSLDGLDAVSFVASFDQGTSGSCQLNDGNVGLFKGDTLRWLVYAAPDATQLIGTVEPFEDDAIRIWSGDFLSQPVVDLHLDAGKPSLSDLAASESFCNGQASVPNIYGKPIGEVRKALTKAGWGPVLGILDGEMPDSRSEALQAAGLIEVEGCSGTGFGYCRFGYAGQFGDLSVVTVGEGDEGSTPNVARYNVTCAVTE